MFEELPKIKAVTVEAAAVVVVTLYATLKSARRVRRDDCETPVTYIKTKTIL
jgi:hypothetical protein